MSYRIEFGMVSAAPGGVLRAIVSGGTKFAAAIARDIGEQARRNSARQVVIDLRRLHDRVGRLALLTAECASERVAVVDARENDRYYVFAEAAARSAGRELRRFDDERDALDWLWGSSSPVR